MKTIKVFFGCAAILSMSLALGNQISANEPKWSGPIIAFGNERETIKQTPILERSYRPLHFYGNTVRRVHYRGTPVPLVNRKPG